MHKKQFHSNAFRTRPELWPPNLASNTVATIIVAGSILLLALLIDALLG